MAFFPSRISIPYGAIKREAVKLYYNALCEFQFLMVRLKESRYCIQLWNIAISIPYGAIKSITIIQIIFVMCISIPYGAIKSRKPVGKKQRRIYISIPYGAIKR